MFHINEVVYYKWNNIYIKYYVKKIIDDLIIVKQYKTKVLNCIDKNELLTEAQMHINYNGELIYE